MKNRCVYLLLFVGMFVFGEDKKGKHVFFVDSYHAEYTWSAEITRGVESVLERYHPNVTLTVFRMDTKRNSSVEAIHDAALRAYRYINESDPDVVIVSDDNAVKYLVVPYLKDSSIPLVFCGVNWDASSYDLPSNQVTGMLEVALIENALVLAGQYAKGNRLGYLSSMEAGSYKNVPQYKKNFGIEFDYIHRVKTFDEWKTVYKELQDKVDIFLLENNAGIKAWDRWEAINFVNEHANAVTFSLQNWMADYALITLAKEPFEQGKWAAETAVSILQGTSVSKIPVAKNKQAKVILNMKLAKKMGVRFPVDLIERSHLVSAEQKKLLFVNSYHKGYKWSDEVEKGLFKALNIHETEDGMYDVSDSPVRLKVYRMNTKINHSESFKRQAARSAKQMIDVWKPDIIVASDDNAQRYLIVPYYKNTKMPVVFCGVNWDASSYEYPAENITGVLEVSPIEKTLELLTTYAKGDRTGILGSNTVSAKKEIAFMKKKMTFTDVRISDNFEEWQSNYIDMQKHVDRMIILNPIGIENWNVEAAKEFIKLRTTIPTGAVNLPEAQYTLLGCVKIPQEQGWLAGKMVLRILEGVPPGDIPVASNKNSLIYLNTGLANELNIKFPVELLERAELEE